MTKAQLKKPGKKIKKQATKDRSGTQRARKRKNA
jgi:hypothetical protein